MFDIALPIERRSVTGSRLEVSHLAADLPRGLEPDEYVVLRDATCDRRYLGRVVGIDFTLEDTLYDVVVEGALAAAVADRYTADTDDVTTESVAALLRAMSRQAALV